jgi:hypothetical protein
MIHKYFRKSRRLWDNVEKYSTTRQTTDENMAHAHRVIYIKGYKRTLTKCNNYCFSTAIIFALKRLNVTLYVHCFAWSVVGNVVIHYVTVGYATTKDATTNNFFNIIRIPQRTQMLQRKRRNTIGRSRTRVHMTFRAFSLWLERQSSSLLSFARFSYQFISIICLFAPLAGKDCSWFSCALDCLCFLLGKVCS